MKGALDIHQDLLGRGVQHEIVRLPRLVMCADEIAEAADLPGSRVAVVRCYLADGDRLVAAVVPAQRLPRPEALLDAVGARTLMLAGPDVVSAVCDYPAALVSPLLLPPEVAVVVDRVLADAAVVYAPTGDTGTAVGLASEALLAQAGARVADLCGDQPTDLRDGGAPADVDLDALPRQPAHPVR